MEKAYIFNLETGKIELHFTKEEYMAMPGEQKTLLKHYFRFHKYPASMWASKAKEPNLYRAIDAAKKLGFTVEERSGERLSFAEQVERNVERAEARADRYEGYAGNAEKRAESMQSGFNSHRGDIAFFTQPITPNAGGRAFRNYRDRLVARYNRGLDEYRKSAYFRDRASISRETASTGKYRDVAYLDRRITEQRSTINKLMKNLLKYEDILLCRENGDRSDHLSSYSDDEIRKWCDDILERVEVETDKLAYFLNCLDEAGGLQFSKENIKPGYIVLIRGGRREILKANPKTVDARCLQTKMVLNSPYAEIQEVVEAAEKPRKEDTEGHPYVVGDILVRYSTAGSHIIRAHQVVKTTARMIEIRELALKDGIPQAGEFLEKPVKKTKPFVNIHNQSWQVSDSSGWICVKYVAEAAY